MDLIAFLNARYDEAESGIRAGLRTEEYGVSQFDLDDIAAKRQIVQWCGEREQIYTGTLADDPEAARPEHFTAGRLRSPADSVVLRYLAAVYADHPDYQQDWRP